MTADGRKVKNKDTQPASPARVKSTQGRAVGTENFQEKVVRNTTGAEREEHGTREVAAV